MIINCSSSERVNGNCKFINGENFFCSDVLGFVLHNLCVVEPGRQNISLLCSAHYVIYVAAIFAYMVTCDCITTLLQRMMSLPRLS